MVDEVSTLSPIGRSDHAVLSWEMLCYWHSMSSPILPRLALHRGNYKEMILHLKSLNWLELVGLSPEEQEKEITSRISKACAYYIPMHIPNQHHHKYPGVLRKLLNHKCALWARFTRTKCDADYDNYLELRRRCVLLTRDHKRKNQTLLLQKAHTSPKLLFRYLRSKRKTKPSPLSLTTQTGNLSSSPAVAAETLAFNYQSVFSVDNSTADVTLEPVLPEHGLLTSIHFPVNVIEKLLSSCDPGGSAGPDGIHPRVLKECSSALALPYSILFSTSFSAGCLPPLGNKLSSILSTKEEIVMTLTTTVP
jgi:hypothetical protein